MLENKGQIDHEIPIPLYFQLKELILGEIRKGEYKPGDPIPAELELSQMFGLSRTTVRQASAQLVQEGWLYKVKSRGTFVGHPRISHDLLKRLESFDQSIEAQGMQPGTQVKKLGTIEGRGVPEKVREVLGEGKLVYLLRQRTADQIPVLAESIYLPYETCSWALEHDFSRERLTGLLQERPETRISYVEREIEVDEAGPEDVRLLSCQKGKAILCAWSVARNEEGKPVGVSSARYRGDYSRFQVTVFPEDP